MSTMPQTGLSDENGARLGDSAGAVEWACTSLITLHF